MSGGWGVGIVARTLYAAFADAVQLFDHSKFSVSIAEAAVTDPQQRLVLQNGYAAFYAMRAHTSVMGADAGVAVVRLDAAAAKEVHDDLRLARRHELHVAL